MNDAKCVLIFDLDGTLIDSVADLASGVKAMLAQIGLPTVSDDQVKSWVGNGSMKLVERALTHHGVHDESSIVRAHEIFLDSYAACSGQLTQAYDGVSDGLVKLKQAGHRLAIVTNKPERFLPEILTKMGWQGIFEVVLGGDSLPVKKPDPQPLLEVCRRLQVSAAQAVMIGDSKNDILAGQAAGMTTLALSYGYNYGEPIQNSQPDAVFDHFAELTAYLLTSSPNCDS